MCSSATTTKSSISLWAHSIKSVTVYGATVRQLQMQKSSLVTITEMTVLTLVNFFSLLVYVPFNTLFIKWYLNKNKRKKKAMSSLQNKRVLICWHLHMRKNNIFSTLHSLLSVEWNGIELIKIDIAMLVINKRSACVLSTDFQWKI